MSRFMSGSRGSGRVLGAVFLALLAAAACGGGGAVSGPRVGDPNEIVTRLRRAGLGCAELFIGGAGEGGLVGGGSCVVELPKGSRALTREGRRWCSTDRTPKPPIWYRCQLDRPDQPPNDRFGFTVYRTDDAAEVGASQYRLAQCRSLPAEDIPLYQVRGPNWVGPVTEVAVALTVADALDATVVELDCPER